MGSKSNGFRKSQSGPVEPDTGQVRRWIPDHPGGREERQEHNGIQGRIQDVKVVRCFSAEISEVSKIRHRTNVQFVFTLQNHLSALG